MPSARLLIDGLIVIWVVAWVGMGVAVAEEVRDLARLSDTVVELGQAASAAGQTLETLESLPLVGAEVGPPARAIEEAGVDAIRSGRESRSSADRLAILLGVSIAIIPSVGVLGLRLQARPPR